MTCVLCFFRRVVVVICLFIFPRFRCLYSRFRSACRIQTGGFDYIIREPRVRHPWLFAWSARPLETFFGHHLDWTLSGLEYFGPCDTAQTWTLCHRYPSSSDFKDTRFASERQRESPVARSDIRETHKHHNVTVIITPALNDSRKHPRSLLPSSPLTLLTAPPPPLLDIPHPLPQHQLPHPPLLALSTTKPPHRYSLRSSATGKEQRQDGSVEDSEKV